MNKENPNKRIHYLRAWRRRWGFTYGQSFVAVKECVSRENRKPDLSFIVGLDAEQTESDIEKLVRTEILKRIRD